LRVAYCLQNENYNILDFSALDGVYHICDNPVRSTNEIKSKNERSVGKIDSDKENVPYKTTIKLLIAKTSWEELIPSEAWSLHCLAYAIDAVQSVRRCFKKKLKSTFKNANLFYVCRFNCIKEGKRTLEKNNERGRKNYIHPLITALSPISTGTTFPAP